MIDDGLKILQGKEWTCWLIVKCSHSLVKAIAAQRWSRSLSMFNAMVTKREITEWGCHVASTWANLCLNHSGTDSVSVKYNQVHPASNTLLGCWFMCSSLTQIIHGWKHCLLAVKAKCFIFLFFFATWGEFSLSKSEFSLVHWIQKRLTKKREKRREKYQFPPLLRTTKTVQPHSQPALLLLPQSCSLAARMELKRAGPKRLEQNSQHILDGLPLRDISAGSGLCAGDIYNAHVHVRVPSMSVHVNCYGTPRICSLRTVWSKLYTLLSGQSL